LEVPTYAVFEFQMSTKSEFYELEQKRLTIQEIKEYDEFKDLSDNDLENLSDTIYLFSTILIYMYEK